MQKAVQYSKPSFDVVNFTLTPIDFIRLILKERYTELATSFGKRTDVLSGKIDGFVYKYEPSTRTAFVGTSAGKIKTFYKWDGRPDQVIDFSQTAGLL